MKEAPDCDTQISSAFSYHLKHFLLAKKKLWKSYENFISKFLIPYLTKIKRHCSWTPIYLEVG